MKNSKNTPKSRFYSLTPSTAAFVVASFLMQPLLMGTSAVAKITDNISESTAYLLNHPAQTLNAFDIEKRGLSRGRTKFQVWSGSFWPDINGSIADHYRDHKKVGTNIAYFFNFGKVNPRLFSDEKDVKENYSKWNVEELNKKLSPTEKYDLLIGNTNFEFTQAVTEELAFRQTHTLLTRYKDGQVDLNEMEGDDTFHIEGLSNQKASNFDYTQWSPRKKNLGFWSGICDGWGPASVYLPRPVKPVTVKGARGETLIFYPDDLKALGSYLFARTNQAGLASMNYSRIGNRCNEKKIKTVDHGFVKTPACNDVDPGVFHATLANRIGIDGLGFIMDIDNNIKVNNHPIFGYDMTYINLKTGKEVKSVADAVVHKSEVKDLVTEFGVIGGEQKTESRRDPNTVYLLGVKVKILASNYVFASAQTKVVTDDPGRDVVKDDLEDFYYDLELDSEGNILGGEWGNRNKDKKDDLREANQPDFIWMGAPGALPYSYNSWSVMAGNKKDFNNPRPFGNTEWNWDGNGSHLPEDWKAAALADLQWAPPVADASTGKFPPSTQDEGILKSAVPLPQIVYYLFDQARSPAQK